MYTVKLYAPSIQLKRLCIILLSNVRPFLQLSEGKKIATGTWWNRHQKRTFILQWRTPNKTLVCASKRFLLSSRVMTYEYQMKELWIYKEFLFPFSVFVRWVIKYEVELSFLTVKSLKVKSTKTNFSKRSFSPAFITINVILTKITHTQIKEDPM